ncbi:MAG: pilus assembly protein [Acidimicrobiia bacterium]|nr:pilus assembly protein [Acidimicrobiia bacterium]
MRRQRRTGPGNRCHRANERGAILAEFALVAPVLIMIVFGIIEFAFVLSRSQAIEAAAREGGRLASLSSTTTADIEARVGDALVAVPLDGAPTVTVSPVQACLGREGQAVTVTVTAPHRLTIPLVLDRQLTLQGRSVFRCEA